MTVEFWNKKLSLSKVSTLDRESSCEGICSYMNFPVAKVTGRFFTRTDGTSVQETRALCPVCLDTFFKRKWIR